MSNSDYVFISYSRRDTEFVERMTEDLRENGVEVWVDTENIAPGSLWQKEIEKGVRDAKAFILVLSPSSVKSKWMFQELLSYHSEEKTVIPVLIDEVDPIDVPEFISVIQWIDFRKEYHEAFAKLLKALHVFERPPKKVQASKQKQTKGYAFLSYAEEDSDFIQSLRSFLKDNGYAYWDYDESDRDYHSQLFLELEGIINEASVTLSILSEFWKRSQWTVKEFFFSEEVGTPVFLLKAKRMGPTLAIAGMTYIDFTQNIESGFSKLHRELKRKGL